MKELGRIGKAACVAENSIILALNDPDIAVRLAAAAALGDIDGASHRAAWGLHGRLQDT